MHNLLRHNFDWRFKKKKNQKWKKRRKNSWTFNSFLKIFTPTFSYWPPPPPALSRHLVLCRKRLDFIFRICFGSFLTENMSTRVPKTCPTFASIYPSFFPRKFLTRFCKNVSLLFSWNRYRIFTATRFFRRPNRFKYLHVKGIRRWSGRRGGNSKLRVGRKSWE